MIKTIQEELSLYPDLTFDIRENQITYIPKNSSGFEVGLSISNNEYVINFDGWREHFHKVEDAKDCFLFGLSEKCRLLIYQKGMTKYKWILQSKDESRWEFDSEVGLLFYPFWLPKKKIILQNNIIKNSTI